MTLRELRENAKLNITEAANKLEITTRYLSMIENNERKPSIRLMNKMSIVYKQKPEKIFLATYRTLCSE